jgi:hypothetical protein
MRARAEKVLAAKGAAVGKMPLQDVQTLVHELQVHQIELEMQNEELPTAWILSWRPEFWGWLL